jgi:hypothetical protein
MGTCNAGCLCIRTEQQCAATVGCSVGYTQQPDGVMKFSACYNGALPDGGSQ